MKILKLILTLTALSALFTACKDDKEGDITPRDADYTGIVLNEVCGGSAADDTDDWVEIYNKSAAEVDLAGVQLLKTDEEGVTETVWTAPAGTKIAAGAYRVVRKSSDELSAKISNTKKVTITLKSPSGSVTVDVFDRNEDIADGAGIEDDGATHRGHALGGSYARIPNGTGSWTVVSRSTPGAENAADEITPDPDPDPDAVKDYSGLVLNELNGNDPKFIELFNKLDKAVDLAGVQLRKNDESPVIWIAPAALTIPAGGRLVLLADQATNDTAAGFEGGLSAKKSVKIELLDPAGTLLDVFKNLSAEGKETWDVGPKYNGAGNGESYGRYPDGTGDWSMMAPSQNAANTAGTTAISMEATPDQQGPDYTGLALNELCGNKPQKYIELYNASSAPMDIAGVQLRKDGDEIVYVAPAGTTIAVGGFLLLPADQDDYTTGFTSGLSAKKSVKIELLDPDAKVLDVFMDKSRSQGEVWGTDDPLYNGDESGNTYGRYPDGTGKWYMTTASAGTANAAGETEIVW